MLHYRPSCKAKTAKKTRNLFVVVDVSHILSSYITIDANDDDSSGHLRREIYDSKSCLFMRALRLTYVVYAVFCVQVQLCIKTVIDNAS